MRVNKVYLFLGLVFMCQSGNAEEYWVSVIFLLGGAFWTVLAIDNPSQGGRRRL